MPTGRPMTLKVLLCSKKGDEAVSFLLTTAMLIFIFATLISAMAYIMQYYNASYICRRVVRHIEITGQYDEAEIGHMMGEMQSADLEAVQVQVEAPYFSGRQIQLRDTFKVTLTASYRITILALGGEPVSIMLPIQVKVAGMSEVYWKE